MHNNNFYQFALSPTQAQEIQGTMTAGKFSPSNLGHNQCTQCFNVSCFRASDSKGQPQNSFPQHVTRDGEGNCAVKRNRAMRRDGTQDKVETTSKQSALPECSYLNDTSTFILHGSFWPSASEQMSQQRYCTILLLHEKGQKASCNWEQKTAGFVSMNKDLSTVSTWLWVFCPE